MRKLLLVLGVALLMGFLPPTAHAQVEIFGGYSYARPSMPFTETLLCPGPACPTIGVTAHPNMNGWEVTGVYNAYHWIGLAADFSGHYGSVEGSSAHLNTFLFGPQVRLPGPVSPFAHVLIGAARETLGGGPANNNLYGIFPQSSTAFAAAAGAGIDVHVAPFVSFRPIQLDYIVTRFGSATQGQPRASAGLVLHF